MEFHSVLKEWTLEEMVLEELAEVVETTTGNGYETDDDDDDGYSDAEEWMFGDEEWLVSDSFLADMADEETFRPNVSSTPGRPTTPPSPASIFQPFTDIETLKSWYQPGSATPPPPTPVKRKLYEDDDDEIRHVRQRLD
ncbi:hypothetical protein SNE40_013536 [Patella caerulea]|uniref:Uncharacterized protein n=1 Tax=Patella caerulea TaxID=87958 RepID=A0AAN8JG64_PATCE